MVHGFIDGFSRLITGLRASNNNRGETVLSLFLEAAREYGVPNRLRGDHGVENLRTAAWMEANVGIMGGRPYIWGRCVSKINRTISTGLTFFRSVHNTRIERLWVDVKTQVLGRWMDGLRDLEENYGLDIENDSHIWLVQELFLPMVNTDLRTFQAAWNNHTIRRPGQEHRCPAELFVLGMYEHGIRGYQLPNEAPQESLPGDPSASSTDAPQRLNSVEVNPPEVTEERLFLSHQISAAVRNGRARAIHEIWTESLIDSRTVFPTLF